MSRFLAGKASLKWSVIAWGVLFPAVLFVVWNLAVVFYLRQHGGMYSPPNQSPAWPTVRFGTIALSLVYLGLATVGFWRMTARTETAAWARLTVRGVLALLWVGLLWP